MSKTILLGSDPELFLKDKKTDAEVSAEGFIVGTKKAPKKIGNGCHIQLDNVACEFNISPTDLFDEFNESIEYALQYITDVIERNGLAISKNSSCVLTDEELSTKNAKRFGCDPDYNVYETEVNDPPEASTKLRTVAGHIHIGYEDYAEVNIENTEKIVKAFDLFVTVPSILRDSDRIRRKMYGKAGAFRFKDYGVEIRTLSNFWIFDKESRKAIWQATMLATKLALSGALDKVLEEHEIEIVQAINNYDENIAQKLIEEVLSPFWEANEVSTLVKTN